MRAAGAATCASSAAQGAPRRATTSAASPSTEARAILAFSPRARGARLEQAARVGVANAEHNHELVGDELRIAKVYADEGPTLKRFRPRAMGRATRIRKRTSHLTIQLDAEGVASRMGQKVHPESMRVGYIHDWKSNWFNERDFADYLLEDVHIRDHITNKLAHAGLSDITIRKNANEVEVNIHTARPGIVIGKSGSEVDALRATSTR